MPERPHEKRAWPIEAEMSVQLGAGRESCPPPPDGAAEAVALQFGGDLGDILRTLAEPASEFLRLALGPLRHALIGRAGGLQILLEGRALVAARAVSFGQLQAQFAQHP